MQKKHFIHLHYLISILLIILFTSCTHNNDIVLHIGPDQDKTKPTLFTELHVDPQNFGFIVYDPEKKQVLQSHNRDQLFIPASTLKIATVTAALEILGKDFRFKTFLTKSGAIKNNVLHGNICLTGNGDPWLSVTDFLPMIEKMQKLGIKKINGKFFYDDTALIRTSQIDTHMEYDAVHNTSISALSLDYNSIYARWEYNPKRPLRLVLVPQLPFVSQAISTTSRKDKIKLDFKKINNSEIWLLSPDTKNSGWQRLPVKQPALFTAYMFKKLCEVHGIDVPAPVAGNLSGGGQLIHTHVGKDLLTIAETTLYYSINIMAELMYLTAAKKLAGKPLDLIESGKIITNFYKSRIKGINWTGLNLVNGSGLSSKNRVSPEQLLALVLYAESKRYDDKSIFTMLPVSGWKWSLQKRLFNPDTALRVWAKTGTINYAMALAGVFHTKSGKKLFFTFLINDIHKRTLYEKNPVRRSKQNLTIVGNWAYRHRKAMDTIITNWINQY